MIPFIDSYDNGFDWKENYWDLNILCEKQLIKHTRPFAGISKDYSCWYCYLWWWTEQFLEQIVQISVIFISNKSIIKKIKKWYLVSLTSIISAKTWSNWTYRGCFENVRTSRFQICLCQRIHKMSNVHLIKKHHRLLLSGGLVYEMCGCVVERSYTIKNFING